MKKSINTIGTMVLIAIVSLLFAGCDYFNRPLLDYLEEWTNTAQVSKHTFDDTYPVTAGLPNVPSGEDRVITYYIINPQNYVLDSTVTFAHDETLVVDNNTPSDFAVVEQDATDKNIIWATDMYHRYGEKYAKRNRITVDLITSYRGQLIRPRVEKSKAEQQKRVRQKAEVFTPAWVCNIQNNLIDEAWFGCASPFNREKEQSWQTVADKIPFFAAEGKSWKDYVEDIRIEMTCGEAPYLTSRYDTVTGEYIPVQERIGLLDRKLRVITENTETREEWFNWAIKACQSVYGFEYQGDNVLIARENLLFTVIEHYKNRFGIDLLIEQLRELARIISWNIWQMDGLKYVVPESCGTETKSEETLFETITVCEECPGCKKGSLLNHNGIYCRIMNWKTHKSERFVDSIGEYDR